jgi:hypothetical protein
MFAKFKTIRVLETQSVVCDALLDHPRSGRVDEGSVDTTRLAVDEAQLASRSVSRPALYCPEIREDSMELCMRFAGRRSSLSVYLGLDTDSRWLRGFDDALDAGGGTEHL